jgi:hypothetical protein
MVGDASSAGVGVVVAFAGANTARSVINSQGKLAACASNQDPLHAAAPPPQCGAPIRLILEPIEGRPWPDSIDAPACPPQTYEDVTGACRPPRPSMSHACRFGEVSDCVAQCTLWNASSCNTIGYHAETGMQLRHSDVNAAQKFYSAACKLGHKKACTNSAKLILKTAEPRSPDGLAALDLLQSACNSDDARACTERAKYVPDESDQITTAVGLSSGAKPRLNSEKSNLLERGCRGGDPVACEHLGSTGRR